jgi:predicted permease
VLVISQVALSLVLLVTALLFSGSLRKLLAVDAGFQRSGVLVANIDFSQLHLPVTQRVAFKHALDEKIRAVPGIAAAGEVGILPLSGGGIENHVWREGTPDVKSDSHFNWLGSGYLKAMGVPLLAGRDFSDHDTLSSPRVAIVNESFARTLGLGSSAVGARFVREATPGSPQTEFEVIGVVRDTKYYALREKFMPIAFLAIDQDDSPDPWAQLVIHSTVSLSETTSSVRRICAEVNRSIGLEFQAFETTVEEGLRRERLMATLSGFFGALAALIAAVGLYGVMSYLVVRRTSEIGVRIALGAGRGTIAAMVLRQAAVLVSIGAVFGVGLAVAAGGLSKSILFGLEPHDLATMLSATALLSAVAGIATYLPARRASRMDPLAALREE